MNNKKKRRILLLEPFHGGSHAQLVDRIVLSLEHEYGAAVTAMLLPGRKWKWRLRLSAHYFADAVPQPGEAWDALWCSSMCPLAELVALRPDLGRIPVRVVYFHENQAEYPCRPEGDDPRERALFVQTQWASCRVATHVHWNSAFNRDSFLGAVERILWADGPKEQRPPACSAALDGVRAVSTVVGFPVDIVAPIRPNPMESPRNLTLVWPHRWEWDKDPVAFFRVVARLRDLGMPVSVVILGEAFGEVPPEFSAAQAEFGPIIRHMGFVASRDAYLQMLATADVVVSTARHEFFGVSTVEAVLCGCYPLCPDRLAYPELLPKECLYRTEAQLLKKIRSLARLAPESLRKLQEPIRDRYTSLYSWKSLSPRVLRPLLEEEPVRTT